MKKFEYLEIGLYSYKIPVNSVLNNFGKDGWELVCVTNTSNGHMTAYFKREITK